MSGIVEYTLLGVFFEKNGIRRRKNTLGKSERYLKI